MLLNIFQQFNWVDIFVVIVLFRIGYVSLKKGLPVEIFKLLGTLTATYLSLHYYSSISLFFQQHFFNKREPLLILEFFVFLGLVILGYLIFVFLRGIFYRFIKMEAVSYLNRWGGLVLGLIRGVLFVGLVIFMLVFSGINYFNVSAKHSFLGRRLFDIAPTTYSWLWNAVASKFMTAEKFNNKVTELQQGFAKK